VLASETVSKRSAATHDYPAALAGTYTGRRLHGHVDYVPPMNSIEAVRIASNFIGTIKERSIRNAVQ
jgi:hypothetical protein